MTKKLRTVLTACYFLLASASLAYELGIRVFNRGNSEFAGMLSMVLTLPSSLLVIWSAKATSGVRPGDSDIAFVVTLGLSAVLNACVIWIFLGLLGRQREK